MNVEQLIEALNALPASARRFEVRVSSDLAVVIGVRLSRFIPNRPLPRRSKGVVCIDTETVDDEV